MNVKTNAKRLLALMLAALMLVGLLPAGVLAADEPIAVVVAASDFQQRDGHTKSDSVMEGIIAAMVAGGVTKVDGALFCGDYSNSFTAAESNTGLGLVYENYKTTWGLDYEDIVFVQGNHDPASTSNLDKSGANDHKDGKYGVFVINEDDYGWASGDKGKTESEIKATANNLKSYLDQKVEDKFDAPIFIASHLPLHYSIRTYKDGDCRYAQYIFDVLNEGAEKGLNIIYLYGHNHSQSFENYHGGGAAFYSKGDEILISDTTNNKTLHTETIQFTYLNAGFTGRFDDVDTADPTNTGTVYKIYEDKVVISRYDANGLHNLKSKGVRSQNADYGSTEAKLYGVNERVETSPQTIELQQFSEPITLTHEPTGVSVTAYDITDLTVTKTDKTVANYSAYVSYDITPAGYKSGKATVVIPVDTTVFDASRSVKVIDQKLGTSVTKEIVDGKVTFTTDHFSVYDVAQLDSNIVTAEGFLATSAVWRKATSFVNGETYLLVSNRCGGADDYDFMAMTLNGTAVAPTVMTQAMKEDAEGAYIDNAFVTDAMKWVASSKESNRVKLANNGNYLLGSNNTKDVLITTTTDSGANYIRWGITNLNGYQVLTSYYQTSSNTGRYARYSEGAEGFVQRGAYDKSHVEPWHLVASGDENSPVTLTVKPGALNLLAGISSNLNASVLLNGAAADNYSITWSSSDTAVATVDGSGKVTGAAEGSATITATLTKVNNQNVDGTVSVEIPVTVSAKKVKSIAVDPMVGSVPRNAKADAETGSTLTVTYEDDTAQEIPVTVGMLSGSFNLKVSGEYTGLTVTYGDQTVTGYTLNVLNAAGNNYPEYPNEGAVKVGKTGTGIDFQSSGIAQVEISASGVPQNKGADVIIMLDTSSSMNQKLSGTQTTRLAALKTSLKQLIQQLQKKHDDGSNPDIRVAVTDFNGYNMTNDPDSAYHRNHTVDRIGPSTTGGTNGQNGIKAQVFTNVNGSDQAPKDATAATLNATAFQDINTISMGTDYPFDDEIDMHSGTNYDYAFDVIYQLGESIQAQNAAEGVDRDLFVIFMSDGGPFQYNYFSGDSSGYDEEGNWNDWLNGTYASVADVAGNGVHKYFYNGVGNSHRMADAIKGDPGKMYDVIRKDADPDTFVDVTGDGRADDYMVQVPGLGATMYSIGFCIVDDNDLTKETIDKVIRGISTDPEKYFYSVDNGDSLDDAFTAIGSEIAYAAYNARFVDQMGKDYNLQMAVSNYTVVNEDKTITAKTITPKIEVLTYDIYTKADADADNIPEGKHIGDRKGTYKIQETVTFSADGKEAYSDKKEGNILIDGVICAQSFWYNTTSGKKTIEGVAIPDSIDSETDLTVGSSNELPAETFYWKMGTVQTSELAMRYYVYLDGSMEGSREAGSYPTNNYATLYYDNYLGNPCHKETVSPVLPWKEANVSYAFYLVNDKGEIIVNQTSGETGTFANKIQVTNPVVYDTVFLNTNEEIDAVEAAKVLPDGYTLFDAVYNEDGVITDGASYKVTVNSNTTGGWEIKTLKDVPTTYVMHYDPKNNAAYSRDLTNSTVGNDYTHTTVWFAVLWDIQALPDTVVIDYGLPVDISVLANDMFGENGKLAGVGAYSESLNLDGHDTAMASGFGAEYTGTYGTANVQSGKVRYTPANMEMNGYEKFAYTVNYTGNENAGFYYDTVTVIPATTIYYEDNFVDFDNLIWQQKAGGEAWEGEWVVEENPTNSRWSQVGITDNKTQAEDRPGFYSMTDANNIYGYDAAYNNYSTWSMGSAMKANVDYDHAAQASFTFYGTGFDVISMTDATTGMIMMFVYPVNSDGSVGTTAVKSMSVDTYYGYIQTDCHVVYTWRDDQGGWILTDVLHKKSDCTEKCTGRLSTALPETGTEAEEVQMIAMAWIVDRDSENAIWQVPVAQMENLPYGHYKAVIQAVYDPAFDHADETSVDYDFYLDAIRIYDPANDGASDGSTDTTIEDAYKADKEGWPSYIELRNKIIAANSFDKVANDKLTEDIEGLVFIDGDNEVGNNQIADYISYGPNNEVYLDAGQKVAFLLSAPANIDKVHIGVKSADGNAASYTIYNVARADILDGNTVKVKAGATYGAKPETVSTSTDMYYDLTGWKNDIIVIENNGTGIISLTNIKSTYTSDPNGTNTTGNEDQDSKEPTDGIQGVGSSSTFSLRSSAPDTAADENQNVGFETYIYMTPAAAELTVDSLNGVEEDEIPENTEPEVTEPEVTEPEVTEPEATEPEVTEPEVTEPETEATEPETEATEPETEETKPGSGNSGSSGSGLIGLIKKLFGWLFG